MDPADRVVRAITNDNAFRIITIRATDTVQAAVRAQKASGPTAGWFGQLLTGVVLVRETMSPELRVQCILKGETGSFVADALPDGLTRGLVNLPAGVTSYAPSADSLLQVVRTMSRGELHQGVVKVGLDISTALTTYMLNSEQVVSVIGVDCHVEADEVRLAGGYIVQMLPEMGNAALRSMTARVEALPPIRQLLSETSADPDLILARVVGDVAHTRTSDSGVRFGCLCDQARVVGALASLGEVEIRKIVESGEVLTIACDYCGVSYQVSPAELRGLLEKS